VIWSTIVLRPPARSRHALWGGRDVAESPSMRRGALDHRHARTTTTRVTVIVCLVALLSCAAPGGAEPARAVRLGAVLRTAAVTKFPVWSSYFTATTPFHMTIAQLLARGATIRPQQIATDYWMTGAQTVAATDPANPSQSILTTGNSNLGSQQPLSARNPVGPVYLTGGLQNQPARTIRRLPRATGQLTRAEILCSVLYGPCDYNGRAIALPAGATESGSDTGDHHIIVMDPSYAGGEFDGYGWGSPGAPGTCDLEQGAQSQAIVDCGTGGFYPFSGDGVAADGGDSSGNAGGYAFGALMISGQELLDGYIGHAIAITQPCTDDTTGGVAGVWPWYEARFGVRSDSPCRIGNDPSQDFGAYALPNARYGDVVAIKPWVNVNALTANPYCRAVLHAMQTYGAYIQDNTGSWQDGLALGFEDPNNPLYPPLGAGQGNPWDTIYASWETPFAAPGAPAAHYANSWLTNVYFPSCLGYWSSEHDGHIVPLLNADDIEIVELSSGRNAILGSSGRR